MLMALRDQRYSHCKQLDLLPAVNIGKQSCLMPRHECSVRCTNTRAPSTSPSSLSYYQLVKPYARRYLRGDQTVCF